MISSPSVLDALENESIEIFRETAAARYPLNDGETLEMRRIRFRTLGCCPLTTGVDSNATTMEEVVQEVTELKLSERATRLIDGEKEHSMEKKKTVGYF